MNKTCHKNHLEEILTLQGCPWCEIQRLNSELYDLRQQAGKIYTKGGGTAGFWVTPEEARINNIPLT